MYGAVGAQTELTSFADVNLQANPGAKAGWDLVKQFLGTPSRVRLTSMSTAQFLDIYFP